MDAFTSLFANSFFIAAVTFGLPIVGVSALLEDGLSRLYGLLTCSLLVLILKTPLLPHLFPARTKEVRIVALLGVVMAVLGLWISLLLSKMDLPNPTQQAYAVAGFPLQAFTYPMPPMGADFVPHDMWAAFFFNYLVWIVLGNVIAFSLQRFLKKLPPVWLCVSLIVLGSLYGLGYLIFKFD